MGQQYVDVCDKCLRAVIKTDEAGSSDMIAVKQLELLYLSDEYLPLKLSRPSLSIIEGRYCPDCFLKMIEDWVLKLEALKPSDIYEVVQRVKE